MQGREREIDTLSVRRPQPHTPTYRGKEDKGKIIEEKKERATRPTKRHSSTGSTRSFERDTERGIKVMRCDQSGEAHKYTDVRSKHRV